MDNKSILESINKSAGIKALTGDDSDLVVNKIPFLVPQLDRSIGGGIPKGRITEIVGDFSTGKSTLCNYLVKSAQREELNPVVYFDAENKVDPDWMKANGIKLKDVIVVKGNIGEDILDSIISLIDQGVGLVIVDSIAALIPMFEAERTMAEKNMATQAGMMAQGFRKMLVKLSTSKTALVFINQEREGFGMFATKHSPGGKTQYYYATMMINVRRSEWINDKNNPEKRIGFMIETKTTRNNCAPPWQKSEIPFYYTGEIDLIASVCQLGLDCGVIRKSGGWYSFGDNTRAQGWDNFVAIFKNKENRSLIVELNNQIQQVR